MNVIEAVALVAGLLILRFALPVLFTLAVCYAMNGVCNRWHVPVDA